MRQVVFLKDMLPYLNKQKRKVKDLEGLNDGTGSELTSIPAGTSRSLLVCVYFVPVSWCVHVCVQAQILPEEANGTNIQRHED